MTHILAPLWWPLLALTSLAGAVLVLAMCAVSAALADGPQPLQATIPMTGITTLQSNVQTQLIDPGKAAMIALGGGIAILGMMSGGIAAGLHYKGWRRIFFGGVICGAVIAFAPFGYSMLTGIASGTGQ